MGIIRVSADVQASVEPRLQYAPVDFPEGAKLGKLSKWFDDLGQRYGRDARLHFDIERSCYVVAWRADK